MAVKLSDSLRSYSQDNTLAVLAPDYRSFSLQIQAGKTAHAMANGGGRTLSSEPIG